MSSTLVLNTIRSCQRVFEETGFQKFSQLLQNVIDSDFDIDDVEELEGEANTWKDFSLERKNKMIEFGCESMYAISRYYILSYNSYFDTYGRPCIALNEMPEEVSLKDNPCKNVILIYSDVDVRDKDFQRLRLILNTSVNNDRDNRRR